MTPNTQVTFMGSEYPSLVKLAQAQGVASTTLSRKIRGGMSVDDAVAYCKNTKKYGVTYNEVYYNSLDALAEAYNINEGTLRWRVYEKGMSIAEAIETPVRARNIAV